MGKPKKEDLNVEERLCGNVKESEGRKEVFHQTPVPRKQWSRFLGSAFWYYFAMEFHTDEEEPLSLEAGLWFWIASPQS
jgi:hypothetical protein